MHKGKNSPYLPPNKLHFQFKWKIYPYFTFWLLHLMTRLLKKGLSRKPANLTFWTVPRH